MQATPKKKDVGIGLLRGLNPDIVLLRPRSAYERSYEEGLRTSVLLPWRYKCVDR